MLMLGVTVVVFWSVAVILYLWVWHKNHVQYKKHTLAVYGCIVSHVPALWTISSASLKKMSRSHRVTKKGAVIIEHIAPEIYYALPPPTKKKNKYIYIHIESLLQSPATGFAAEF